MATIVVGDIHGHIEPLNDLLEQLTPEIASGDTVVFLGDYVDRGPDSRGCVDAILTLASNTNAEVVCLCGNHEDWLLRTRTDHCSHSWVLGMDGLDTVRSYSLDALNVLQAAKQAAGARLYSESFEMPYGVFFDAMPIEHHRFFDGLRTHWRTPECLCSHAGVDPRVARLEEQTRHTLLWGANGFPRDYSGTETIVYGHWNNATLDAHGWPSPVVVGPTIGLDTIAFGVLSAVRLPERRVFQSARYNSAVRSD